MQTKDDRFPRIVLVGQPSRAKRKAGGLPNEVGGCRKEIFKGNGNLLGKCKEGGFEWFRVEEEFV